MVKVSHALNHGNVAHPHSNCRAELGVKTVIPTSHVSLQKHTRPGVESQPRRDHLWTPHSRLYSSATLQYLPHWTWRETLEATEDALRVRNMRVHERLSEHMRVLPPVVIGNCVRLQNMIGPHPTKWDRTGIVVEYDSFPVRRTSGRVGACHTSQQKIPSPIHTAHRQSPTDLLASPSSPSL